MWRADGSDARDRLADYWDARAARRLDLADLAADLDPGLIDTIIALEAQDDVRLPDPAFLGRLERSLLQAVADTPTLAPNKAARIDHERRSARVDSRAPSLRTFFTERRPWALGHLAAAALLLFTLGIGYFAVRLAHAGDWANRFPAGLATSAPPSPDGVSAPVHLLRLTLTQSFGKNQYGLGVWRETFAPNAYDREIGRADLPGDQIFFVESGTITARLLAGDRPATALGNGLDEAQRMTTPEASGLLRVAAGEAALLPGGTTIELRSDGDAPATIRWILGNSSTRTDASGVSWNATGVELANLPQTPALLTLDRATMAPNAKIGAPPAPAVAVVGLIDPPFGYLLADRDGSARNISASPRDVYIMTLTPLQSAAAPTP